MLRVSNGALSRVGPYLIATVQSTAKYTLCSESGESVEGGRLVDATHLEAA